MPKIQDHTWLLKDQQVLISTFLAKFLHGQIVRTVLKPNMQFPAKTRYVDIPGMSTEALNCLPIFIYVAFYTTLTILLGDSR